MDLEPFVSGVQRDLAAAVPADSPAAAEAERLAGALGSSLRLHLLQALAAAADELATELAPASIGVSLSGGRPLLRVDGLEALAAPAPPPEPDGAPAAPAAQDTEDAATARFTLRLPSHLKSAAEAAAAAEGVSLNAWLLRVLAVALSPAGSTPISDRRPAKASRGSQRLSGWMS